MADYKGIPTVMRWVIGVLVAIIVAEGVFLLVNGTDGSVRYNESTENVG